MDKELWRFKKIHGDFIPVHFHPVNLKTRVEKPQWIHKHGDRHEDFEIPTFSKNLGLKEDAHQSFLFLETLRFFKMPSGGGPFKKTFKAFTLAFTGVVLVGILVTWPSRVWSKDIGGAQKTWRAQSKSSHKRSLPESESSNTQGSSEQNQDGETLTEGEELELAKIRLLMEKKQWNEVMPRLQVLLKRKPQNLTLIQAKAQVENQIGQWPEALKTLENAKKTHTLEEDQEDLESLRQSILKEQNQFISLEGEYKKTGSTRKDTFGFLSGRKKLSQLNYLGFDLQQEKIFASQVINPKNAVVGDSKAYNQKGDVFVDHFFHRGHSIQLGLYGAPHVLGAHIGLNVVDPWGHTRVQGKYHRPDWDNVGTVIYTGSRDTLSLERLVTLTKTFSFQGEMALNLYNIQGTDHVAESYTLSTRLNWERTWEEGFSYIPGEKTTLGMAYTLDGEYVYRRKYRLDNTGTPYSPLGVGQVEMHGLEAHMNTQLSPNFQCLVYGGYALSRFVRNSFFGGTTLDYTLWDTVHLGAEYENRLDTSEARIQRFRIKVSYDFS